MAERKSGLGGAGRQRIRENLGAQGATTVAGHQVTAAGIDRAEHPDTDVRDMPVTPWEYPDSTRVKAYQYDYQSGQLRVKFHKYGTPWVYNSVPTMVFQAFDASPSKGMYINSTLNFMDHRKATVWEDTTYFANV